VERADTAGVVAFIQEELLNSVKIVKVQFYGLVGRGEACIGPKSISGPVPMVLFAFELGDGHLWI
jgi:hypothetical protein